MFKYCTELHGFLVTRIHIHTHRLVAERVQCRAPQPRHWTSSPAPTMLPAPRVQTPVASSIKSSSGPSMRHPACIRTSGTRAASARSSLPAPAPARCSPGMRPSASNVQRSWQPGNPQISDRRVENLKPGDLTDSPGARYLSVSQPGRDAAARARP